MARIDHARANAAERMRRHGVDQIDDYGVPAEFRAPPKRRQSKADMRAELAAATANITRIVKCRCGHQAAIALPPAKLHTKLRCSKCGCLANIEKEKPAGAASGGLIEKRLTKPSKRKSEYVKA